VSIENTGVLLTPVDVILLLVVFTALSEEVQCDASLIHLRQILMDIGNVFFIEGNMTSDLHISFRSYIS